MNRVMKTWTLTLPLIAICVGPVSADVKTRDKGQVKFEGMLGRVVGIFGGKAAREGVITTNAVKGDRKIDMTESTGRIVDLKEEKLYELDIKKKQYTVTTFEELRRRLREAQEKAEKEAQKAEREERPDQPPQQEKPAKEYEIDFDVKETGQKKQLAGYDTREVVMTLTVREKGKALEDGGGMVVTSNSWIGPAIPAMKELANFEIRYWKAIAPETAGISAEQMAAAMAMYPMLKGAMERLKTEGTKVEGTPLATTTVFEAVKSKDQMAQQSEQSKSGGIGGMLSRRVMKRDDKPRAVILTINTETLEVTQSVSADELQIPAGFKEKK